ncbi:CoA-binding protein [Rothia sp. ZJ932]|uniref:CoA-binding protein n=1 Tax=Rothia sp. ZJ932 TaxID=2810516 RepID=UPI001967A6C8|nr:CoA-binding protein [Rothia sp. ZJ932]QRZ61424.1 CoA-binding protein [Rothia sp. ZJ932]
MSEATNTTAERTWEGLSAPERLKILGDTRSIAIVGMSDKISRASYFVATYLLSSSPYRVFFVNPILAAKGKEVLGQKVYASLADVPEAPDMVEIFRRNEDLPGVVQEAIDAGAQTVWMQLGSWNEEAARLGEDAGLNVVMDRCVKIEHARFHGGLHLAGFNTGVISSKRQVTA